jgi:acetylornithine deacetylase/succinyl-diaminopimelate desuccinylase-like protein
MVAQRPAQLLQDLIRFDTTNPPGKEAECIAYIDRLLAGAGFETKLLADAPDRTNLITRLPGRGDAPPLLLYGHVDVVTTVGQTWKYPPFEGVEAEGYIWGRGALDMKGGMAMLLAALLRARQQGLRPAGDIIFVALADEENAGQHGAKFLVERHADLFEGVRYAISEFGGFSFYIGSQKFYPIQVAEKLPCWMRATLRGPAGHGALTMRGGAMAKLGHLLYRLDKRRLPVHITPAATLMVQALTSALPFPQRLALRQLLNPTLTDLILRSLGKRGQTFESLFRNTVNVTIVRGGEKINVIPTEITIELDGRLLPGFTPDDIIAELHQVIGAPIAFEVFQYEPSVTRIDMGLFDMLAGILRQADPDGIPIPFMLSAFSDARFFSRLSIQSYGFLPMNLPKDFSFQQTIHAADERIPVEALDFGTQAIYQVLERYGS